MRVPAIARAACLEFNLDLSAAFSSAHYREMLTYIYNSATTTAFLPIPKSSRYVLGPGYVSLGHILLAPTTSTPRPSKLSSPTASLLSRSLANLSATVAKYAEHAGCKSIVARDAIEAFGELGTNMDALREYCAVEGCAT
ncbi:uncharacterized protein BXZ73DRAFT_76482 [Epithele typhae]|uniref:uncharacterized protein n=1 Tax=Epithele typhae TaxID=378194 RepID=UPI0020072DD7|nr:uncharacterized protein BXZ73DRAFT_105097 [Epithele typhae]XP_047879297.1 uncharacterized protein BXZ73DRAFT_76482 [Epithele typhae]KAH9918945.1 hypothetical protein BXZ73DRAFT_105097 [Epithele typhae]KAH9937853.1 hypothetical protein BXZ73DRAFT_76482 [Epithele typhae]